MECLIKLESDSESDTSGQSSTNACTKSQGLEQTRGKIAKRHRDDNTELTWYEAATKWGRRQDEATRSLLDYLDGNDHCFDIEHVDEYGEPIDPETIEGTKRRSRHDEEETKSLQTYLYGDDDAFYVDHEDEYGNPIDPSNAETIQFSDEESEDDTSNPFILKKDDYSSEKEEKEDH